MNFFCLFTRGITRVFSITRYMFALMPALKREKKKAELYSYSDCDYGSIKQNIQSMDHVDSSHRFAFVSILPPDESGIATYSLKTFTDTNVDVPVDLYCPFKSEQDKSNSKKEIKNAFLRVYDLREIFQNDLIYKYSKIVIAMGGSCHHSYVINLLNELKKRGFLDRVSLYLHDLHFRDFFMFYSGMNILEFAVKDMYLYRKSSLRGKSERSIINVLRALNQLQLSYNLGLRFFQRLGVKNFIVNSEAAKKLLVMDLDENIPVSVYKIFLPVLPISLDGTFSLLTKESGYTYIGSFGIPSVGKCTPQIIRAVEKLNGSGYKIKLIIAGWNACHYIESNKIKKDWLLVFDSLNEKELTSLMSQMDLAIQLRSMNGGESSGCVPMLISCSVPTIVSDVGSFAEFGEEVIKFSGNAEKDLAEFIGDALKRLTYKGDLIKSMQLFVINHQPKEFVKKLFFSHKCND